MRNYIILNNKNSNTISGLIIQELAPISKPLQRTQVETIDGRDGDIVTSLGYAAYNKKIKIGLYGNFDINEIIAYFATQGTAIFSNEPDKYYNYHILDQIDYERLVRFRVATVTMHVQPFKYSATEQPITVDVSGQAISGEGSDIVLDNTAEAPFNVLRHKGNATQQTYSGKNLLSLDKNPPSANTNMTVTHGVNDLKIVAATTTGAQYATIQINLDATKTYTLSGIGKKIVKGADGRPYIQVRWRGSNDNGSTWTAWENIIYETNPTQGTAYPFSGSFTGYARYQIAFYNNANTPVTVGETTEYYDLQLEVGSQATDYEIFVGGTASPNPDYPQDIKLLTGDSTIAIDDGGDNSQEYVIPFGDTYLAAIGDYIDEPVKVGDTWYIRRKIGKVVIDGTTILIRDSYTQLEYATIPKPVDSFAYGNYDSPIGKSIATCATAVDVGGGWNYSTYVGKFSTQAASNRIWIGFTKGTSLADMQSALNGQIIYYALATPTDEEITDQDLIDALDEFYEQAHAYKSHTHITATAEDGNAPAVLAVEVNQDNETTVTNTGNTTSRPIITIYGQGNIGMYINDVQVLDIALGDEQYITIDSVAMEAYKDTTANLKNRLVTGDYSKLALNAGDNKIYFTGIVTKYEISKYSRWL